MIENQASLLHIYKVQHQQARCYYNKHAITTGFAREGKTTFSSQQNVELIATMRDVLDTALKGAKAASDMIEVQALLNMKNLSLNN